MRSTPVKLNLENGLGKYFFVDRKDSLGLVKALSSLPQTKIRLYLQPVSGELIR
jgi:hypothetical protein